MNEPGMGVDSQGGAVVDPTKNVLDLFRAGAAAARDLREADEKLASERNKHVEFVAKLRAEHSKEMRISDNERLASLRREDQATAASDKKTVLDAVQALAGTTESVRLQLEKRVSDTATTLSEATAEGNKSTETRIAALEKASYTGAGEKSIADPRLEALIGVVDKLAASSERRGGITAGGAQLWAALGIGVTMLIAIGSFILSALRATGKVP
jgi:hypothetical protein